MSKHQLALDNSQVPEGYKQTEVGVIPEDWQVNKIGEIANVDPENLTAKTYAEYQFKYISLEDVDRGTLKGYSEQVFSTSPSRARRVLRYGDVLFSTVRPNLKSHLLFNKDDDDWVCSTGFSVLRCQNNLSIAAFLFFHLFSGNINKQIETLIAGSNYPAINSSDVRKLEMAVPEVEEQRAIAQTLSDVDGLIAALDKAIAKKRNIKTATMQELLTGKKRLPGFGEGKGYKNTEVGVIPEDWRCLRISEVVVNMTCKGHR
ncbi:MAG: restriction endonuclease subunit S [Hormoscilla sp. GM7CHS1pb]|nr:restriction endonuclease subunit S [Hormoscilla sp. GM7CHS1pb]